MKNLFDKITEKHSNTWLEIITMLFIIAGVIRHWNG